MNFWYIQRLWSQEDNLHLNGRVRASSSNMDLDIFFIWIFQWIGNSKWILSRPIAVFLKYNYEMFRLLNVINSDVKLKILLQYCMQKPFKQS